MNPLENLLKALSMLGTGTAETRAAYEREMGADRELNQGGSLMGSERQQQLQGDKSPLVAALGTMSNKLNPMDWMGGFGGAQAMLGPIRSKAQKHIVRGLAKKSPDLLDIMNQAKEKVNIDVGPTMGMPEASGSLTGGNGILKDMWINIHPDVMRGRLPQAIQEAMPYTKELTGKQTIWANTPATAGHEAQHAVNRIAGMAGLKHNPQRLEQINSGGLKVLERPGMEGLNSALAGSSGGTDNYALADETLAYLRQNLVAGQPIGDELYNLLQLVHPKAATMFKQQNLPR